jgi:putative Holliday junction resolvase
MGRILGIDLGNARTGFAVSDETKTIATAIEAVKTDKKKELIARLKALIGKYNIEKIVIGLPFNMDGTKGIQAKRALLFAEEVRQAAALEVETVDERLSTKQGEAILISADMSRKKRKQKIDSLAAQIILQSYLDLKKDKHQN